jgi:hypothetical protein
MENKDGANLINNIIYNIFMEVEVYLKPIDGAISTSMAI